jgi:hypothetical protein
MRCGCHAVLRAGNPAISVTDGALTAAGNVAINGDDEFEGGRLLVATGGKIWAASRKVTAGRTSWRWRIS